MAGDFTVGVEEEYQLVCAATGELRSRARDVLAMDWSADLQLEIQETMLEIGTRICGSAAELDRELRRLRLQVASVAAAEELLSVAAGIHPFSDWEEQSPTQGEHYRQILARFGRVIRTEHVFGMHVHVQVPKEYDRIHLMNAVRSYIPHLLALSASSPIYEGEDTGYASYRTILTRRLPFTGPPPHLSSEASYRDFVGLLLRSGAIEDEHTLYWSIRPHPEYPTLEFRVTDVCPRVDDAAAIAALTRALVVAAAEGRLPAPSGAYSASAADALLQANEWQAARYGLDAVLVDPTRGCGEPLRDAVLRLLDHLRPVAEALGDSVVFSGVEALLGRGNGAGRIREVRKRCGELPALVRWLAGESLLGTGLDRRREQRAEA
jgi:carboxylate-amine ligase